MPYTGTTDVAYTRSARRPEPGVQGGLERGRTGRGGIHVGNGLARRLGIDVGFTLAEAGNCYIEPE